MRPFSVHSGLREPRDRDGSERTPRGEITTQRGLDVATGGCLWWTSLETSLLKIRRFGVDWCVIG